MINNLHGRAKAFGFVLQPLEPRSWCRFLGIILTANGRAQRVTLAPADSKLSGKAEATLPANVKGVAQLTAPDGKLSKANSNKPRAASYPQSSHGSGFAHSHHESFSAGDPGDPMKPARIVSAVMREANGKMLFVPDRRSRRASRSN